MNIQNTYCNPIPLPNYPIGFKACEKPNDWFLQDPPCEFRETADPSVIYYNGAWYLYSSCGMAYMSEDFITWKNVPIIKDGIGYAPTVVEHDGKFILTACHSDVYVSDSPLGTFTSLGRMLLPNGEEVPDFSDPMLFSDNDGRLYVYWGIGGDGIRAAEVNPQCPNQLISEPQIVFAFNPENEWERFGPSHEDYSKSFVEGAWMLRVGSNYYLTYAAPGTEWRTYCMGVYVSDSPMGPFRLQKNNPLTCKMNGLVQGAGHGCITRGPNDTLWAFYTCTVCYEHIFERRIGYDPVGIDENDELFVREVTETPQYAPGVVTNPELGNSAGLFPVTLNRPAKATSIAPGRTPIYAVDSSMLTWWQPTKEDSVRELTVNLRGTFTVYSARIVWKDVGLSTMTGVMPGAFQYQIECSTDGKTWKLAVDASNNADDLLIDYRVFDQELEAEFVRLRVTGAPVGITPGVIDFTVFGKQ